MLTASRVAAFCSADGPEIFRPVAYPTEVWYPDPLDVEAIYADARELYERLLRRATAPDAGQKVGRMLLLRGESGSGKTHLMRAFRTRTHQQALGYFGYMQMTTSSGNYSRYILQKLIDSLDQPYYSTPASPDHTTGLMRLSTAVAESAQLARAQVQRLQEDELGHDERAALVLDLADDAVCDPLLRDTPLDLVRAMLFLQSGHPAIRSRVMKYLRAESLSDHDRQRLGGISPLDRDESAQAMIERLGRLMWAVHGSALVLCVDQLEDIALYEGAEDKFRRAIKGLTQVAAQVPSSLVVVACLEDYYDKLRGHLDKSALDRIENDPSPLTLPGARTWDEIRAVVGLHLNYLFEQCDLPIPDELSTDPLPDSLLRAQVKQTTRTVLKACKAYRDECVRTGRLVAPLSEDEPPVAPPIPRDEEEAAWQSFDQDWNDFLANFEQLPLEDDQKLADLLAESVELCSDEVESVSRFTTDCEGLDARVYAASHAGDDPAARCLIRLCNNSPQGGSLGKQIEGLLELAAGGPSGTTPVVVRCTEYRPKTPKSTIARLFARLYAQAGRYVMVRDSDWRIMAAIQLFRLREQEKPHFDTWLCRAQPLVRLKSLREILSLDGQTLRPETSVVTPSGPSQAVESPGTVATGEFAHPKGDQGPAEPECEVVAATADDDATTDANGYLVVGQSRNRAQQPVRIPIGSLVTHTAFLGSTGSGKTTAALNLIEQLLLRGIPALLVDRKGDLVSYARSQAWTNVPEEPELRQRHRRLREILDVAIYTPGCSDGRPILLPVAPDGLGQMKSAERNQMALQAAHYLGGMLGYKPVGKNASRISIMVRALDLLAEQGHEPITIDGLIDYINERDDALLSAIGLLDVKLFDSLLEALQTLSINKRPLFPRQGEPLRAEQLFGLDAATPSGKTRLSVISTKFLGDAASVQFWVAQLLLELSRWLSKRPRSDLQAVVLFDEADLYLPATSKPATKEPMESLLKRARSGGLGIMLATQSPGDFDYKCRENINTWLLGKIKEDAAIKKMKPMLSECSRDVSGELAGQHAGDFFLVERGRVTAVRSQRSVVEAQQVSEAEILQLARTRRP